MSLSGLLKKLERALTRSPKVMAKTKTKSKPRKLRSSDIARIEAQSKRNAAAYAAEFRRKHPDLARRFK